jgi:glycosyltransferase involved in cell wall biosynthesis
MTTQDAQHQSELNLLRESGLFQADYMLARSPALAASTLDPLEYFCRQGWRRGDWPNPYFDPAFYLATNPDVAQAHINPLLHYAAHGDREGRDPCPFFDVKWYRANYALKLSENALAHFLARRTTGEVAPVPFFDPIFYFEQNPDVATNGGDPFEHFLAFGAPELRDPSEKFDIKFYVARYGAQLEGQNPLLHFLKHKNAGNFLPARPDHEKLIPGAVKTATRPSPYFEDFRPVPATAPRRAKLLAFYLPQYHSIPENDAWWGKGFTDWTNLLRAVPRFAGHLQPRIPRDLGFYNLADPATLTSQIELARNAGIHGFVFYHYWFNRKPLLEAPLNQLLADKSINFPFCVLWANENFTRRWDGLEREILLQQEYLLRDDETLIDNFSKLFEDPRYIQIASRPLLMLYRPALIPDPAARIAKWRTLFAKYGHNPLIIMAQSINDHDPRPYNLDGAVEFPPHKLTDDLEKLNDKLDLFDSEFSAAVYDYATLAATATAAKPPKFPLIKTAAPGWDNDPRREGKGLVLHNSTPKLYQTWLENLITYADQNPFHGEQIICINAWNEWAEGAFLEPDIHFGAAYLNATARAVCATETTAQNLLVLVGHDAHPHGAQLLLLALTKHFAQICGFAVHLLLLGAGRLLPEYEKYAKVTLTNEKATIASFIKRMAADGAKTVIVNTAAAARLVPALKSENFRTTLLIHEMPKFLAEHNLQIQAKLGAQSADATIFASAFGQNAFCEALAITLPNAKILPQGNYQNIRFDPQRRQSQREKLNIPDQDFLIVAIGFGDLRKGFDLFAQLASHAPKSQHFVWVGEVQPTLKTYLAQNLHITGFTDDITAWLSAADVFALPSREDPFPTVAIEALSAGLPIICFDESGGIPALLRETNGGAIAKPGDPTDFRLQLTSLLDHKKLATRRPIIAATAETKFNQPEYAQNLLKIAAPSLPAIEIAILNYNQAPYLRDRLASVFTQTHPVQNIIFYDDASTDESLELAAHLAKDSGRHITIDANNQNAGAPYPQWSRAARAATAEFLWLAEADDSADPEFLSRLAATLAADPAIVCAFTDSRILDSAGKMLAPNYQDEYRAAGVSLATSQIFHGKMFVQKFLSVQNLIFNVSAVLWRRTALITALNAIPEDIATWKIAGDWRLYFAILTRPGAKIAFLAEPLNRHRRHQASATHTIQATQHGEEIAAMQRLATENLALDPATRAAQKAYLQTVKAELLARDPAAAAKKPGKARNIASVSPV